MKMRIYGALVLVFTVSGCATGVDVPQTLPEDTSIEPVAVPAEPATVLAGIVPADAPPSVARPDKQYTGAYGVEFGDSPETVSQLCHEAGMSERDSSEFVDTKVNGTLVHIPILCEGRVPGFLPGELLVLFCEEEACLIRGEAWASMTGLKRVVGELAASWDEPDAVLGLDDQELFEDVWKGGDLFEERVRASTEAIVLGWNLSKVAVVLTAMHVKSTDKVWVLVDHCSVDYKMPRGHCR